jgi:hypothetical protein
VIVRASNEKEELWLAAMGIDPKIPADEIRAWLPDKLEKLLPGLQPLKYEIVHASPYWVHGRVVLAGMRRM